MNLIWGATLTILTLIAWIGQTITAFSPKLGQSLGLTEPKSDVDPAVYADNRGEAIWDATITWTLPIAGILLMLNNPIWVYFGLVGGGMYLYLAGRFIFTRLFMQRHGIHIGQLKTLKLYYAIVILWGIAAVVTIFIAVETLPLL